MADDQGPTPAVPNGGATNPENLPEAKVLAQYVKDLSFENPNSPAIYQGQEPPQIDIQFNIATDKTGDDTYEISLKVDVKATVKEQTMFQVELVYGGLFGLRNIPEEQMQPFLLIDAPSMLFPFARRILADTVRDGNFPPLMLDPIDFGGLYLQQQQQMAEGGAGDTPIPPSGNA